MARWYRLTSIVVLSVCLALVRVVYCGKTEDSMEVPFGVVSRVDPRNHAVDGGPDLPYGNRPFGGKWGGAT